MRGSKENKERDQTGGPCSNWTRVERTGTRGLWECWWRQHTQCSAHWPVDRSPSVAAILVLINKHFLSWHSSPEWGETSGPGFLSLWQEPSGSLREPSNLEFWDFFPKDPLVLWQIPPTLPNKRFLVPRCLKGVTNGQSQKDTGWLSLSYVCIIDKGLFCWL